MQTLNDLYKSVPCPHCEAEVGRGCMTELSGDMTGAERAELGLNPRGNYRHPHKARKDLAMRTNDQLQFLTNRN